MQLAQNPDVLDIAFNETFPWIWSCHNERTTALGAAGVDAGCAGDHRAVHDRRFRRAHGIRTDVAPAAVAVTGSGGAFYRGAEAA